MRWALIAAMLLAVLGAVLNLVGGADGAVWTTGLWVVIVGGAGFLMVLLFAPQTLSGRTDPDEG